jgi:hypothetical protein
MATCQAIANKTGRLCVYKALPGLTVCGCHNPFKVETCAICLDDVLTKAGSKRLKCGHVFHGSCINQWLRSENTNSHCCATCRTPWRGSLQRDLPKLYMIDPTDLMLELMRDSGQVSRTAVDDMDQADPMPIVLDGVMPDGGTLHIRMTMANWRFLLTP